MIKKLSDFYIDKCVDIAYLLNNQPASNCAYCPKEKEHIKNDFAAIFNDENNLMLGYFDKGVLICIFGFFVDPHTNWVDCVGPFFIRNWDIAIAMEMFDHAKIKYPHAARYNFYFDTSNEHLHQLAQSLSATRGDNEYLLMLDKDDYKPQPIKHTVVKYNEKYRDDFICTYTKTFPNPYISAINVLEAISKDRNVFCILDADSAFVGFGVLKHYPGQPHATAEIFGVDEKERGKGYGWAVLNTALDYAIYTLHVETVDLIVDKLNINAAKLYYSCGFELKTENAAYFIKK